MAARLAWPKVPAFFVRAMLAGHSALGLGAAALIYLVCLSGTVAVFVEDFGRWEQPGAAENAPASPEAIATAAASALMAAAPGEAPSFYVKAPVPGSPRMTVTLYGGKVEKTYAVDAAGLPGPAAPTPWSDFMADLHMTLNMPGLWGGLIIGLSGIALASLLVSGLLSHPRIFKDAFTLRWGGSRRLQEADLHNRLSVWGLPFHIVISATGALLGLGTVFLFGVALFGYGGDLGRATAPIYGPEVKADPSPAPLPDWATTLRALKAQHPHGRVTYLIAERAGTKGQQTTVEVTTPGRLTRGERYVFDGQGKPLGPVGYAEGAAGVQVYGATAGLHFGTFGGLPVRLLYGAMGLALTAIVSSGMAVWFARRRDKGRPVPKLERAWLGAVWGVPVALAISAVVSMIAGAGPLPVFWAGVGVTLIAAFAIPKLDLVAISLRAATAACLIGAVIVHTAVHGAAAWNAAAGPVNAVVVLLALILAGSVGLNVSARLRPGG